MIIVLLGYMGAGKSVIGKRLAQILKYSFVDLDAYIEKKEKATISELFKNKGEIYFRKQEHLYLKELLSSSKKMILAVGGGTPCYASNMNLITQKNIESFYLQLPPTILAERLFLEKEKRPLIAKIPSKEKLMEFIAIHLFERQIFYNKATHIINTSHLLQEETVAAIVEKLY